MKTIVKQLTLAATILLAILIIFSSFKSAQGNSIAKGGGIADGIHFNFDVIKHKNGTAVGHVQYRDDLYSVVSAEWFGTTAILYTNGGVAFMVADNGGPLVTDWISDPIPGEPSNRFAPSDFFGLHNVTNGNIQVRQ